MSVNIHNLKLEDLARRHLAADCQAVPRGLDAANDGCRISKQVLTALKSKEQPSQPWLLEFSRTGKKQLFRPAAPRFSHVIQRRAMKIILAGVHGPKYHEGKA
jgi:hypothetical protein